MPLFRQDFAVKISRSVGIASPCAVIHTKAMYKSIILLLVVFSSSLATAQNMPELSASKQALINQAKTWVAQQTQLDQDQVEVSATDRRLKIPLCDSVFNISFSYPTSQESIRVSCPSTGWQVFVGIKLIKNTAGLAFKADLPAGQILSPSDVKLVRITTLIQGLVREKIALENMSLSKPVVAGDLVLQQYLIETVVVFQLKKDILAGEFVKLADIQRVRKSLPSTSVSQRFPSRLLSQSTAARDLRSGITLSRDDLKVKHIIMVSNKMIARGQKLSSANATLKAFYGALPSDALLADSGISQMEAIRTIRPGQPIRASDLRPAALVRKGDMVMLSIEKGSLTINIPMLALEKGQLDQQITLLNPESNEQVRAIVTGPRKAGVL